MEAAICFSESPISKRGHFVPDGEWCQVFHRRRATLRGRFVLPRTRGRSYGSDSELGKRGVDWDRGGGGGAVVEVAVVVESVSRASKERGRGIGLSG
jgi:hypothetical protein